MTPGDFRVEVHEKRIREMESAMKRMAGELEQAQRRAIDAFEFQNSVIEAMQDRIYAMELLQLQGKSDGR